MCVHPYGEFEPVSAEMTVGQQREWNCLFTILLKLLAFLKYLLYKHCEGREMKTYEL